jgi:signal transduction histidine kinase
MTLASGTNPPALPEVAHDLKNLLTGILKTLTLLRPLCRGLKDEPRLARYVNKMRCAGEPAATLVEQLMAVARQKATEAVEFSWNPAVKNLYGLLRRLTGRKHSVVLRS